MNLQELQTLVDYHYWARDRLFEAVERLSPEQLTRDLGNSFPSIRDTLVHLFGAERIWCARWEGVEAPPRPDAGAFGDLAAIRRAWSDSERSIRGVLDRTGEGGLTRSITYKTLDGTPSSQPFWQMLQHVVNHGSYHRGQVTTLLRQLGAAPARSMDLIAFYRERVPRG